MEGTGNNLVTSSRRRAAGRYGLLPLSYLLAHFAAISLFPGQAKPLSFAFLILAPLGAGTLCLARTRHGDKDGWTALALAMLLWAGGMTVGMCSDLLLTDSEGVPGLGMLLYVLYGVPLTFLVASPEGERWPMRVIDGMLALALGWLFFVHTFTFATLEGASDEGVRNLRLMFDLQNLFIALFALVRYRAAAEPARRALFRTLTLFAFVYLASAAYINHFQVDTDFGGPSDLVIDLPFLLLAGLALGRPATARPALRARPSPAFVLFVQAGSPLMLPATLLVVSALLVSHRPALATVGFVTALAGYGLRTIFVQMRGAGERDRLDALSRKDALTGLANRRQFDATLRGEWNRARRTGGSLALLIVDIDHFKLLNDNYGHQVGDERLCEVAQALAGCATRAGDLVARLGGEEFAAILPASDAEDAALLGEQMRRAVSSLRLASPAAGGIVTVSVGVASFESVDSDDPAPLVATADAALYDAKKTGRNRVVRRFAAVASLQ
jgi:diguanylate cyclase (GGDEF)-like protein